jgi:hypothetical protein
MRRHITPTKPKESRPELLQAIFEAANERKWTGTDLMRHLLTFFTDVDLKLILDEMRDSNVGNHVH